jgi:flavin-dependent dehydrogenase
VLTRPRSREQLWWGRERVLAIGEAAGLISPFSGEGVSYALSSAEAAAFAVLSGGGAALMPRLTTQLRASLSQALLKAWAGERPGLRPWALWLLPLATHRQLTYHPWREPAEDV